MAGRPSEDLARTAPGAAGARGGHGRAGGRDPEEDARRRRRPADAGHRPVRDPPRPDLVHRRARCSVSRRPADGQLSAPVPVPVTHRARSRLRRADQRLRIQGEAKARLPADRQHRPDRRRGDVRPVPSRQRRLGAAHRRLARPPNERSHAEGAPAGRQRAPVDDRHRRPARRRARAEVRDRARELEWPVGGQRRSDRRDRPARRFDSRPRVESDLRTVGLRESRSEQARSSPERSRRNEGQLSRRSTARSA